MLVLSRKPGESLVIGEGADRVTVKVIEIRENAVRLGVEAPRKTAVHRSEVAARIEEQERRS